MCPEQVDRCMSIQRYYLPDSITSVKFRLFHERTVVSEGCVKIETHGTWLRFSCRAICLRYRFEAWVIQQYPNARIVVSENEVCDTSYTASDIAHRGNCNVHISLWCCRRGVKIICYGFIHKAKNQTNLIYSKPLNDTIQTSKKRKCPYGCLFLMFLILVFLHALSSSRYSLSLT